MHSIFLKASSGKNECALELIRLMSAGGLSRPEGAVATPAAISAAPAAQPSSTPKPGQPQALATQPLPFRCPMDHMLPIANWHGTTQERAKRRRCALPAEAHGPPENGMPYRTHGWLSSAQAKASLATFAGTLVPDLGGAPLAAAQRRDGRRRAFDMADARARLRPPQPLVPTSTIFLLYLRP